jgi:hypothetical protein
MQLPPRAPRLIGRRMWNLDNHTMHCGRRRYGLFPPPAGRPSALLLKDETPFCAADLAAMHCGLPGLAATLP